MSPVLAAPTTAGEPASAAPVLSTDRLTTLAVWTTIAVITLIVLSRRGVLSPGRLRDTVSRRVADLPWVGWFGAGLGLMILWRLAGGVGAEVAHGVGLAPGSLGAQATAIWAGHAVILAVLLAAGSWRPARTVGVSAGFVFRRQDLLVGLGAMLLTAGPVLATLDWAALIADLLHGSPEAQIAHDLLGALAAQRFTLAWWAVAIAVTIVTPIVEETTYRGFIQSGLVSAAGSPALGIALSAGVFALVHVGAAEPRALPGLFVLGLAFGLAFERTGRLGVPIVMHAIFNAGMMVMAHLAG